MLEAFQQFDEEMADLREAMAGVARRRCEFVLALRDGGMTIAEISGRLKISQGRVSQMLGQAYKAAGRDRPRPSRQQFIDPYADYAWYTRDDWQQRSKSLFLGNTGNELSLRAIRALIALLGTETQISPTRVADNICYQDIFRMPNCGRKTANEVAEWLIRHGALDVRIPTPAHWRS